MSTTFSYYRGEPVVLDLVVSNPGAYDAAALTLAMRLKPAAYGVAPSRDTAAAGQFDVTFQAAAGAEPAFWRARLPDAVSGALLPGSYVTDGQLLFGAAVIAVTDPLFIMINESVTPA